MKLDLNNRNVFEVSMTVDQVRKIVGDDLPEDILTAFDEAQGHVHSGEDKVAYIVIEVS